MLSKAEIRQKISKMSPAQKAGQLFFLAFPGKDPEIIRPIIEKYGICGCYISQDNAETFEEATVLTSALQSMTEIPLLLGVDQEGAWGVLIPESHPGPGNLALGALNSTKDVAKVYEMLGREMLSVGYNAVLGPCADVNSDPNSPIIGTRSFGEFPDQVASNVKAAVNGLKRVNSVSSIKHFPGHGATSGDTHRDIPEVNKPLSALLAGDLAPFKAGIDAGCPIVMTSHIRYTQIDPLNPATMSATILKAVLRDMLGFKGVILSDSMNMGAIRKRYDAAESTLLALKAGVDVLMLAEEHYDYNTGNYLEKQISSIKLVERAIESGELPEKEVDEKLLRILDLKYNKMLVRSDSITKAEYNQFAEYERDVAKKAVCLVQKKLWPLPSEGTIVCINATPRSSYKNIVNSRGIGPNQSKPAFDSLKMKLTRKNIQFFDYEEKANAEKIMPEAAAILIVSEDYPLPGEDFDKTAQQMFIEEISKRYSDKVIIVGLRSSYELNRYPENVTYLCANSSRTCSAEAVADLLLEGNSVKITGTIPVSARF